MPRFVPISEAKTNDDDYQVDLTKLAGIIPPYVNKEEIHVNIEAIHEICRLVRVESLRVAGFEKEEQDIKITGHDNGGAITGIATSSKTENQRISNSKAGLAPLLLMSEGIINSKGINFTSETLNLNFAKLKEELRESGKNIRDNELWAKFIDSELKSELLKISKSKNGKIEILVGVMEVFSSIVAILGMIATIIHPKTPKLKKLLNFATLLMTCVVMLQDRSGSGRISMIIFLSIMKILDIKETPRTAQLEKISAILGIKIKLDRITPWTIGEYEWDRRLAVNKILREEIVKIVKQIEL